MAKEKKKKQQQQKPEPSSMAYVGSTGIGSGPHLDLRGFTSEDRKQKLGPDRLMQIAALIQAGDKLVSDYPITSGYGSREAPVPGASTYHYALDFGIPPGTPIKYTEEYLDARQIPQVDPSNKAGNVYEMVLPTGELVQFLHLQGFGNIVGQPPVKATPAPPQLAPPSIPVIRPDAMVDYADSRNYAMPIPVGEPYMADIINEQINDLKRKQQAGRFKDMLLTSFDNKS